MDQVKNIKAVTALIVIGRPDLAKTLRKAIIRQDVTLMRMVHTACQRHRLPKFAAKAVGDLFA